MSKDGLVDHAAQARIAVCDRATSYRRGLGVALAVAGYSVLDVDGTRDPAVLPDLDAVLFTVASASDWESLRQILVINPSVTVIALLVDPSPDQHAEALRCGGHGAVAWDAPPERIVTAVTLALDGETVLPTTVAKAIAASGPPLFDAGWITEEEAEWLRLLARGATVQQLAEKAGYSERAIYRVLHGLYGRMRVSNRTEAILQASRWGLLEI